MVKKLSLLGLLVSTILLSACGYNPQTTFLSPTKQCQSLQRQMLFVGSYNPANSSPEQNIAQRQQIQQQFQNLHCYQVLEKARSEQPGK
ncbi:MAG: hypothetical protein A3E87_06765 [Gammaproteobacteria bacterium RIFCSPHIGHO2_12_FULL_35_23]|nr:MAG: hypothetical protein A3E87_06765 [Gammaproteobacteria bacterium RIFCSPHIGHO2_12_FULL_35_23]